MVLLTLKGCLTQISFMLQVGIGLKAWISWWSTEQLIVNPPRVQAASDKILNPGPLDKCSCLSATQRDVVLVLTKIESHTWCVWAGSL